MPCWTLSTACMNTLDCLRSTSTMNTMNKSVGGWRKGLTASSLHSHDLHCPLLGGRAPPPPLPFFYSRLMVVELVAEGQPLVLRKGRKVVMGTRSRATTAPPAVRLPLRWHNHHRLPGARGPGLHGSKAAAAACSHCSLLDTLLPARPGVPRAPAHTRLCLSHSSSQADSG